jgi:hypothetical protein
MLRLAVSLMGVVVCGILSSAARGAEVVPTPLIRDVVLNLAIDDLKTQTPVQLKSMSQGILAEGLRSLPEALQFEVVIKGAHPDIPVLFPVPRHSPVCQAYAEYMQTDPDSVLASLALVKMPTVRVVALRAVYAFETYEEGKLARCKPTCEWLPYYEVSMCAAACPQPVLVPVPQQDCWLHAQARRAVNKALGPQNVVPVLQLSGDKCQPCPDGRVGACGCPNCGPIEACCRAVGPSVIAAAAR